MTPRTEAIASFKSTFPDYEELSDGSFAFRENRANGRAHPLYVLVEESQVWVSSPFARISSISDEDALRASQDYAYGIGKDGTWYSVHHVWPFYNLTPGVWLDGLRDVLEEADEIKLSLGLGDEL